MKKIEDPLDGIGRQGKKLLDAQLTGKFPKDDPRIMTRNEIERLLCDSDAEEIWMKDALKLALPHAYYSVGTDEITANFLGNASVPSRARKHYGTLVCNIAADVLVANPGIDVDHEPASLRNNLDAVLALHQSNEHFRVMLQDFINARYLDSYVAKNKYGPALASLAVRGEDVLSLIASLDSNANPDGILQFGSIVRVQEAIPDPRHFAERLILTATELGLEIGMTDVMNVAYILYQKRFEYVQAALDLRHRIGIITGSPKADSDIEQAMATTEFSSHQRNILLYGKAIVESATNEARKLGLALGHAVHIDPPQPNRKAGTIVSFHPAKNPGQFLAEVNADGEVLYFELYALKRLQRKIVD